MKQDKCREIHEREVGTLKEQQALMGSFPDMSTKRTGYTSLLESIKE